jgi:hypothetical protein
MPICETNLLIALFIVASVVEAASTPISCEYAEASLNNHSRLSEHDTHLKHERLAQWIARRLSG